MGTIIPITITARSPPCFGISNMWKGLVELSTNHIRPNANLAHGLAQHDCVVVELIGF